MRLKRIAVRGLFDMFDHTIAFRDRESVAIIHGPNGLGKTVILRMIGAMVSGQAEIFHAIPFSRFSLDFDDGSSRIATRESTTDGVSVTFRHILPDGTSRELQPPVAASKAVLDLVNSLVPQPRIRDGWRDSAGRFITLSEMLARYPHIRDRLPPEYKRQLEGLPIDGFKVFFVETNRLLASPDMETAPYPRVSRSYARAPTDYYVEAEIEERPLRVVQYSADLTHRIQAVLASYAKHSQESDRTFPARLVSFLRTHQPVLTEREILDQMSDLEESRRRLINLGFLDPEVGLSDLSEEDVKRAREALAIYVEDVREKLKVFDDMALRVGMLIDIVNDRFKYKSLRVDRGRGFQLKSSRQVAMDLASLSSGEQHQLVLLYELLFLVPKNGLVLIDEPEISLHVAWQARFLSDLLAILKLTGAHALIATHAPAVIGTRWDLTVRLRGPESDEEELDAT